MLRTVRRTIFGPGRELEKFYRGGRHYFYSSPNFITMIECMIRNLYEILLANLKRRIMRGWDGNVKIHFYGTEWDGVKWIYLAQDRPQWQAAVNTVMTVWFIKRGV
jgi:hypothetical protein